MILRMNHIEELIKVNIASISVLLFTSLAEVELILKIAVLGATLCYTIVKIIKAVKK